MRIKLAVGGKEYVTDVADMLTRVTIGEVRTIKRETGMTTAGLHGRLLELKQDGPDEESWDVYAALVYLILSRSGMGHVSWADVEVIPLVELASGLSVLPDEPAEPTEPPTEIPLGELVVVSG